MSEHKLDNGIVVFYGGKKKSDQLEMNFNGEELVPKPCPWCGSIMLEVWDVTNEKRVMCWRCKVC